MNERFYGWVYHGYSLWLKMKVPETLLSPLSQHTLSEDPIREVVPHHGHQPDMCLDWFESCRKEMIHWRLLLPTHAISMYVILFQNHVSLFLENELGGRLKYLFFFFLVENSFFQWNAIADHSQIHSTQIKGMFKILGEKWYFSLASFCLNLSISFYTCTLVPCNTVRGKDLNLDLIAHRLWALDELLDVSEP